MEGDFYKCEEVAFSQDVPSRLAEYTSTRQMDLYIYIFLSSEGQMAAIRLHLQRGEYIYIM